MTGLNPVAWLAWGAAATLAVVTTRNPLYLTLTGVSVAVARLATPRASLTAAAWSVMLRVGLAIAAVSVLFNLLTAHVGDHVLARLPGSLPIAGGPLTLNALVYGLASALALLDLLLVAATVTSGVDRAEALRLVPARLASAGVAAIIALSILPQTLTAAREVREAQAARGFQPRSVRDLRPLIVPVLHLGLEHAFDLAQAMESRSFGASLPHPGARRPALAALALLLATLAAVAFGAGRGALAAGAAIGAIGVLALGRERAARAHRSRYREVVWHANDVAVVIAASAATALTVVALLAPGDPLSYSPYPYLVWPPFAIGPGLAALLLAAPAGSLLRGGPR